MIQYRSIKVYTRERARYKGKELSSAIVSYIRSLKISARCMVFRGSEGCYENGEIVTNKLVALSNDMPIMVEILLPIAESQPVIEKLTSMVGDGIISTSPAEIALFRTPSSLIPPHLLVRDVMTEQPVTAHPDWSVRETIQRLVDEHLKALPVTDKLGNVVGMVTQGDLMKHGGMPIRLGLLSTLPKEERSTWMEKSNNRNLSEIMTPHPQTINADQKVSEALHLMVRKALKRLPVVDGNGKLCGILARIDLLRLLSSKVQTASETSGPSTGGNQLQLVRDVVLRDRLALPSHMPLREAIDILAQKAAQRAAVIDADNHLVGLVTDSILMRVIDKKTSTILPLRRFAARRAESLQLSQVMKREVVRVTEDTSVDEAIRLMTEQGLKRIPVVDADGKFCGMIRRDSILIALSRSI
ncbi:DUF190 domain-containing protein [Sediminispirochaeta bajacaliforniensis]|uniref:DUF190 domain-containing protein n=1 Tax=Sediminispirochaeta bajacaliforniensis TaxID=148 RepID=UPI00037F5660|nr:DUF190 domain-containing protein [Sediminispirochaeta bajacaliforniensis]